MTTVMDVRAVWFTGPRKAEILAGRTRDCGPPDITVKALRSGISLGTEMVLYRGEAVRRGSMGFQDSDDAWIEGELPFPIKYAYNNVGRVVEAGVDSGFAVGDLVHVSYPHQDYYTVRADSPYVRRIPKTIRVEVATFFTLLRVAVNATLDVPIRTGEVVTILGQGSVGLFLAQLSHRLAGRVIVVDPMPHRRDLALRLGASLAVSPEDARETVMEVTGGRGSDITIEASGAPSALQTAIECTALDGTVEVVGWYGDKPVTLVLDPEFHLGRLKIVSSQVNHLPPPIVSRWDNQRMVQTVARLLEVLPIDEMISHRVPFTQAPDVYRLIDEHPDQVTAVVLEYP